MNMRYQTKLVAQKSAVQKYIIEIAMISLYESKLGLEDSNPGFGYKRFSDS